MIQALTYILTPIYFINFAIILIVLHPFQILIHLIFGKTALHRVISLMAFLQIKTLLLLGVRLKYINFKAVPKDKAVLFIGNHQSMYDMPPLMWYFRRKNVTFIAKKELAKYIPTVSYYLRNGYALLIDRKKPEESLSKIKETSERVKKENNSLAIYPEGTRSKDGKIGKFKIGGIAQVLDVIPDIIVIPIAVQNTGKMENRGKFGFRIGTRVRINMLEPRSLSRENLKDEVEKIRKEIKEIVEG